MPSPEFEKAWVQFLSHAPLKTYGRVVGTLAGMPLPKPLRKPIWETLSERIGINLDEAEHDAEGYRSFSELFTRRLKPGIRVICQDEGTAVSPVDGVVAECGRVERDRLIQAKGIEYALHDLVMDPVLADRLDGGSFFTLYLSPKDYHRIHAPVSGKVVRCRHIPGTLYPVNALFASHKVGLFVQNERVVIELDTEVGPVACVCVGATAVGSITTVFGLTHNRHVELDPPFFVERGAELAAFNLGSTVIVVFDATMRSLLLNAGESVRVGQSICCKRDTVHTAGNTKEA